MQKLCKLIFKSRYITISNKEILNIIYNMPVGTIYFHQISKYVGKPGFPRNIFL